jgi:hypothetical protein
LVLRLTLGPAFVIQRGSANEDPYWDDDGYYEGALDLDGNFFGQTGEVSLGTIQVRRVIVGGNLMETVAYNDQAGVALVSVGTYIDYYPISERGFHLRGDVSLGVVGGIDDGSEYALFSWGALVGAGYDTWVSKSWSLGALFRVQYCQGIGVDQTRHLIIPTISFSASYGPISW